MAVGHQGREPFKESLDPIATLAIEPHGAVGTPLEDATHQTRQHRTRADLDEGAGPSLGHGLDHLDEAHRKRQLLGQLASRRVGFGGIGSRRAVGIDRQPGSAEVEVGEELPEPLPRRGDDLRVEGGGHRQAPGLDALFAEALLDLLDGRRPPRQDHLLGGVVVGHHHLAAPRLESGLEVFERRVDGGHGARLGGRLGHQLAPAACHPEKLTSVEHSGGVERRHLAKAMPGDAVGLEPQGREQGELRKTGAADGGLGPLGGGEPLLLGVLTTLERGDREDDLMEVGLDPPVEVRRQVPGGEGAIEVHRQRRPHVEVLATLPRKEKRHPAFGPARAIGGAVGGHEGVALAFDQCRRLLELVDQVGVAAGDHGQTVGRVAAGLAVVGQPAEVDAGVLGPTRGVADFGGPVAGLARQVGGRVGVQHYQLGGVGPQTGRRPAALTVAVGLVLLEGDVEVRATKTKGADRGSPRVLGAAHPGAGAGGEVERRGGKIEGRVGSFDLDGGWQHPVVEGHHRLEQTGGASGALGVTDLALDRAQLAPLAVLASGLLEDHRETSELGGVAGPGAGAMGFDQLDGLGTVTGLPVGPSQGLGLAFGHRGINALRTPVGRRATATDDGVDPVAIALRILQPLEGHHAEPFAEHGAVGLGIEGSTVAAHRQRRGLGEAHEHEDVVHGVDATGDHHVRLAEPQLRQCHRQRAHGRSAGGIADAVGATEVESVGDAAGHYVAQQARKGALVPVGVVGRDALADVDHLGLGQPRLAQRLGPHRPLQPADHRAQQLLARGHPEDHRGAGLVEGLGSAFRGILEHLLGDDQRQQLRGVGLGHDAGGHTPAHGVEVDVGKEGTPPGVGLVGHRRVGIVVVLDPPVARWHVANQVCAR